MPGHYVYLYLYPTKGLKMNITRDLPPLMTLVVATAFGLMIFTFLAYDWFVRHQTVVGAAARTNVIKSLPKNVWDRLLRNEKWKREEKSIRP
jgi:hypothetical protein